MSKNQEVAVVGKGVTGSNFVFVEALHKGLEIALATGENIILYGKGGHGKSEYTEYFLKSKGIEPFVKTLGSGTTQDSLFGGIDIQEFQKTGKIEYLVENSFMNHEYVVFEELFDAPDFILETLKDILTSKKFRNGSQVFNIKTKLIVCCTNKTRSEFSKNDSLKALMERFPLEIKVEWKSYTRDTYGYMFKQVLGNTYPELEYLLEKLAVSGTVVSPRTAIKTAKMIDLCGDDTYQFVAEFSGKNAEFVQGERTKFRNIAEAYKLRDKITNMMTELDDSAKFDLSTVAGIKGCRDQVRKIEIEISKLKSTKVDDETMNQIQSFITQGATILKQKIATIDSLVI